MRVAMEPMMVVLVVEALGLLDLKQRQVLALPVVQVSHRRSPVRR